MKGGLDVLGNDAETGTVNKSVEGLRVLSTLPFLVFEGGFAVNVASSNERHLKSFLYPSQVTFRFWHCKQPGLVSSHFNRFFLHVMHPMPQY